MLQLSDFYAPATSIQRKLSPHICCCAAATLSRASIANSVSHDCLCTLHMLDVSFGPRGSKRKLGQTGLHTCARCRSFEYLLYRIRNGRQSRWLADIVAASQCRYDMHLYLHLTRLSARQHLAGEKVLRRGLTHGEYMAGLDEASSLANVLLSSSPADALLQMFALTPSPHD